VVGVDFSMREYDLDSMINSYMYLIRRNDGVVVYHPLLQLPTDGHDDLVTVYISQLEKEAEDEGVHASMMR